MSDLTALEAAVLLDGLDGASGDEQATAAGAVLAHLAQGAKREALGDFPARVAACDPGVGIQGTIWTDGAPGTLACDMQSIGGSGDLIHDADVKASTEGMQPQPEGAGREAALVA